MHFLVNIAETNHFAVFSTDEDVVCGIESDACDSLVIKDLNAFQSLQSQKVKGEKLSIRKTQQNVSIIIRTIVNAGHFRFNVYDFDNLSLLVL